MAEQKNSFYIEEGNRNEIISRVLSYLHRKTGIVLYEQDIHEHSNMYSIIDAFNNSLEEGEYVKAFFISGERSCGVRIGRGEVKSIPTNEYYGGVSNHRSYG